MEADCLEYQRVTHIRVSMGNRLCTHGFHGDQGTPFPYKSFMLKRLPLIPGIQWVAWRTVPVTGARQVRGQFRTGNAPFPLQYGGLSYRFRYMWEIGRPPGYTVPGAKQGQKGSVMHRFRGHRGKLDAKKYQVPPRFPGLRGCTRPIVNSWVKFFPWGTGEGVPFWACQAKSMRGRSTSGAGSMRRVHGHGRFAGCVGSGGST